MHLKGGLGSSSSAYMVDNERRAAEGESEAQLCPFLGPIFYTRGPQSTVNVHM